MFKLSELDIDEEKFFSISSIILMSAGFITALVMAITIFLIDRIFEFDLCFSNRCYINFYNYYNSAFAVIKVMFSAALGLYVVGNFSVACKNYTMSKKAYAINSHVSRLNMFQSFLASEVDKKELIHPSSIDIFKWYDIIYPESSEGRFEISKEYSNSVINVSKVIDGSNKACGTASFVLHDYRKHQDEMIRLLYKFGISVERMPRESFYKVEMQIFSVIDVVNHSFCRIDNGLHLASLPAYK